MELFVRSRAHDLRSAGHIARAASPPDGQNHWHASASNGGRGIELHQLRAYAQGDPIARIDWKATARTRKLVTREFTEDQHLDVLVAIDAGRLSRVRTGNLDRLGLYSNIASRLAEIVTPNDDRVGLLVFSDRALAVCAPDRGIAAVTRVRQALERMTVQPAESDPVAAAVRIRSMLKPPHARDHAHRSGRRGRRGAARSRRPIAVAAASGRRCWCLQRGDQQSSLTRKRRAGVIRGLRSPPRSMSSAQPLSVRDSRRLGAPVIATKEELLESAVFAEYEALRRSRRI